MSQPEKERARRTRTQARRVCPGCGRPVDLVCYACQSAICKQCGQLTGDLYRRICERCQEERRA